MYKLFEALKNWSQKKKPARLKNVAAGVLINV